MILILFVLFSSVSSRTPRHRKKGHRRNSVNSAETMSFRKHLDNFYHLTEPQREHILKKLRVTAREISADAVKHYLHNEKSRIREETMMLGLMKKNNIPIEALMSAGSESIVPFLLLTQSENSVNNKNQQKSEKMTKDDIESGIKAFEQLFG